MTTVEFKLDEDVQGNLGFIPIDAWEQNTFDSIEHISMFIHDVFEHNHENTEYFKGDAAYNIGGEIAAMGSLIWIVNTLGAAFRSNYGLIDNKSIAATISGIAIDNIGQGIKYGSYQYGSKLVSHVPPAPDEVHYDIERVTDEIVHQVKHVGLDEYYRLNDIEDQIAAIDIIRSFTKDKVRDLLYWGFNNLDTKLNGNYLLIDSFKYKVNAFLEVNGVKTLYYKGVRKLVVTWDADTWKCTFSDYESSFSFCNTNNDFYIRDVLNGWKLAEV